VAAFGVAFRLYHWKENKLSEWSPPNKEMVMKRVIARATLVAVFATVFALAIVSRAQAQECSNVSLQGSFGYTSTGALLPVYAQHFAGPFAEVGRQSFDGSGNTSASATLSANGNIQKVTIQGTYTVNPDCTGSMMLHVSPLGVTVHVDFVIDSSGLELRAIGTDPGVVESRVYKKL
jgi:hypothetical protein